MSSKEIRDRKRAEALGIAERMRPYVHRVEARPDGSIIRVWPNEGDAPTMWFPGANSWSEPGQEQGVNRGKAPAFRNWIWHLCKRRPAPARRRPDPDDLIDTEDDFQ